MKALQARIKTTDIVLFSSDIELKHFDDQDIILYSNHSQQFDTNNEYHSAL